MGQTSMATRDERVVALAGRYAAGNRKERGRILDEFAAVSGLLGFAAADVGSDHEGLARQAHPGLAQGCQSTCLKGRKPRISAPLTRESV
jgi:hypothetical protein